VNDWLSPCSMRWMRSRRASKSSSAWSWANPMALARRVRDMTPPVAIMALDGMQSHKLAEPPTTSRSTTVTSAPKRAAWVAACTPAGPPPTMTNRTAMGAESTVARHGS
jgi:hypothetical protein